jgi:hypothetical protein
MGCKPMPREFGAGVATACAVRLCVFSLLCVLCAFALFAFARTQTGSAMT